MSNLSNKVTLISSKTTPRENISNLYKILLFLINKFLNISTLFLKIFLITLFNSSFFSSSVSIAYALMIYLFMFTISYFNNKILIHISYGV